MAQFDEKELFYSELPNGAMPDAEGNYRWTYEVDSRKNRSFLNLYLLIFGLVILIPGTILFFMIYGSRISSGHWGGTGSYIGIMLLILLGVELLTILIYKGIEKLGGGTTSMPYFMTDSFIMVHPYDKHTPASYLQTYYTNVKDIRLDADSDLILLHELLRVTHVYVYRSDCAFVLNYLFDHLPQSKSILRRKEEYKEYLQ